MTPTELEDLQIAKEAYAIYRAQHVKNFPHSWDGLPESYQEFLCFLVAHARTDART